MQQCRYTAQHRPAFGARPARTNFDGDGMAPAYHPPYLFDQGHLYTEVRRDQETPCM